MNIAILVGVLVIVAAISFRQGHLYLVHLDSAARALQHGETDLAARELQTALAMKRDSPIADFLIHKLPRAAPSSAACQVPSSGTADLPADTCSVLQCDGQPHILMRPDGSELLYTLSTAELDPFFENGIRKRTVSEMIVLAATDALGRRVCQQGWMRSAQVRSTDRRSGSASADFATAALL